MPVVTWPYTICERGITALPGHAGEEERLRLSADAVLHADGSVTEAIPGTHGAGILRLDPGLGSDPAGVLASLYRGGARQLLLDGGLALSEPFLAARLIDRLLAYIPDPSPSRKPQASLPWPQLPPGFAITGAARLPGYVRILAHREPPG